MTGVFLSIGLAFSSITAHEASKPGGDVRKGGPVSSPAEADCRLAISLVDGSTGMPLAGMIRVLDDSGAALGIPELLDRCVGLSRDYRKLGWHVVIPKEGEPVDLRLPPSKFTVESVSGLEYTGASQEIDLSGKDKATIGLSLDRIWKAEEQKLVAGNTHLHLKDLDRAEADRYLTEVPKADGLDVVFVSYLERAVVDRGYITNQHSRSDLEALSDSGLRLGNGEEYRHNLGGGGEGYGHVLFLDLAQRILPASLGPGIAKSGSDGIALRPGIQNAREQGATVVWCHNRFGFEDNPNWLDGLVDAQNIFDGGNQGSYEDSFYRFLNLGLRVPFSTGTDWFLYDFSRVYVDLDGKQGTVENWLEGLRAGRSFITNGPLMEFRVDGLGPGSTVPVGTKRVEYRVVGRDDFGVPELVLNGSKVSDLPAMQTHHEKEGWFEVRGDMELEVADSSWLALRVSPDLETTNAMGRSLFAHTSPVYIASAKGEMQFDPAVARQLIEEMKRDWEIIEAKGEFGSDEERKTVRALYESAIESLEGRLREER